MRTCSKTPKIQPKLWSHKKLNIHWKKDIARCISMWSMLSLVADHWKVSYWEEKKLWNLRMILNFNRNHLIWKFSLEYFISEWSFKTLLSSNHEELTAISYQHFNRRTNNTFPSACAKCTFFDCDALMTKGEISMGLNCLLIFDNRRKYSLRIQEETKIFENNCCVGT